VKDNQTKFSKITEAIGTGDIKLAHRLVHTLKSNAGQLDEILLQHAAANVEENLKGGRNLVTPQQMAILEAELNAVLAEFAPSLDKPPPMEEAQTEPYDVSSARELIVKLESMLEMGSPECLKSTQGLRSIPGSEELIRQIEDFDFTTAIVTLAGLKKKLDV
jgi:HPt (histidine-containing phosphotransfer) domain-containing protein